MSRFNKISVSVNIASSLEKVWDCFTNPLHITHWNFAADTWECPTADNDLRVGGKFSYVMRAKDGSAEFIFGGTYTAVDFLKQIKYQMNTESEEEATREVEVYFAESNEGVVVTEFFDPENQNSLELQQQGWQAILNNFKKYCEL